MAETLLLAEGEIIDKCEERCIYRIGSAKTESAYLEPSTGYDISVTCQ